MALPDLTPTLAAKLEEASELRWRLTSDTGRPNPLDPAASIDEVHGLLIEARAIQDRLEQILVDLVIMQSKAAELYESANNEYEDAWDQQAVTPKTGFVQEEASPRERYATYKSQIMSQVMARREAKRLLDQITAVKRVVEIYHEGMDKTRRAIDSRVRLLSLSTRLEQH